MAIKISRINRNNFSFFLIQSNLNSCDIGRCSYCNKFLEPVYSYIIKRLNKNGLLSGSFKPTCCNCSIILNELGFIRCKECGELLRNFYRYKNGIEHVEIKCFKCWKTYKVISL